jgi:predicted FMN-binding regulatory protein PaiB
MMFYDYYSDVPEQAQDEFVRRQELGRLVTTSADGQPHIGLYPFVFTGSAIDMHLHRSDEQLADLRANPRCAFELDEIHGTIPSHWVHDKSAMFATAFHRVVIFECEADISEDLDVLAAQQQQLMRQYQPEGGYREVSAGEAMYRGPLGTIAALTLTVRSRKVKWKLAQNRDRTRREKVIAELRKRGRPTDAGAADALQWALDREASK